MSEPKAVAGDVSEVVPGVWHWHVEDERIGYISAAHAVAGDDGTVLIDPLPLEAAAMERLGRVSAIVLSTGNHGRSSWRLRDELGVPVHVPHLSESLRDGADGTYGDGDALPGGLRAVFTPGAGTTQHTLLLADPGVAFVPDMLGRPEGEDLAVIPAEYMADPDEARRSTERLLALDFEILCLAHGVPVTTDAKAAIGRALAG
ncbi:MAG TPA: hypothetical protein VH306_01680 [Gaiellaceae bacterium]